MFCVEQTISNQQINLLTIGGPESYKSNLEKYYIKMIQEQKILKQPSKQKETVGNMDKSQLLVEEKVKFASRYAITFGQCSILHVGSQEIGNKADNGFAINELEEIRDNMNRQYGIKAQLFMLTEYLPEDKREGNEAAVLYLPGAAKYILGFENSADQLLKEQQQIEYDKKFYDNRRKKTLNKQARYNIVFGQEQRKASQDYKEYSIKAFKNLNYLQKFRNQIGRHFGKKAEKLNAEGNMYHQEKSGIGFHGDSERKIVICLNLGKSSILRYYWRAANSSENKYGPIDIKVNHGDVYIMSEKASGHDWRHSSKYRLVHAAGSSKYIGKI